ncbi:MAG: hypothetical protein A2W28_00640 [Gammaproteobacteria bacterium RBG_16_51_14]|nr:MAG: hypothetical protein A2W28_00640 [Gammaproteobacteria bacterium RBG_16_51_14]
MKLSSQDPRVSVIIASYNSKKTIEDCLLSLESQATDKAFEVIVVDSSSDGTSKLVQEKFPQVRLYTFPKRKFVGDARNIGIPGAKGDVIALIDADCIADKNWIEEIVKAHQSQDLAIGGAIGNGNPKSFIGWASYFCEFSQWMPGGNSRWMTDIAGSNMSYKRQVFREFGPFIEGTYCSDTELHWRMVRRGRRLRFVPSILIFHRNIDALRKFLSHEFSHGCFFAQVRTKAQDFSLIRRWVYIIFSPLIPLRLFLRDVWNNFKNRIYLRHFLKSMPLLIAGLMAWSWGECVGYIKAKK